MARQHVVFGIRHHGPGCAKSLVEALHAWQPDMILLEGPPDAQEILPFAAKEGMEPPVALMIYPPDVPSRSVMYPFAVFSPEWQCIRLALHKQIPLRFMDLPQCHRLAMTAEMEPAELLENLENVQPEVDLEAVLPDDGARGPLDLQPPEIDWEREVEQDPLGVLATAAGYEDREQWWEELVEQRRDASGLFEGILEAMTALRQQLTRRQPMLENQREAWMRQTIRTAIKEGYSRIAVVCGAWHAPALAELGPASADAALLKKLPKIKVDCTWVPWTYSHLSIASGYGAGVRSPGWYDHLWQAGTRTDAGRPVARWAAQCARLLREEDLDASSASVIEVVRLADALAALAEKPQPSLRDINSAIYAVFCQGDTRPLELIRQKLEISDRLGSVPAELPAVPLQRDLESLQKRLRLKATTEIKTLELDLRNENDRERSRLFNRLNILEIPWAKPIPSTSQGTFKEAWQLQWQPEFVISLIQYSTLGNTIEQSAASRLVQLAHSCTELKTLTNHLESSWLAALPQATDALLRAFEAMAAVSADVRFLMEAFPPLVRILSYGDVRGTSSGLLLPVVDQLLERIVLGVPIACRGIDDEAARAMLNAKQGVESHLEILKNEEFQARWYEVLTRLCQTSDPADCHGMIRGWCARRLVEKQKLAAEELGRLARLNLSAALPRMDSAAWVEGAVRGPGMVLIHQKNLWQALNQWLRELPEEAFNEALPLLRRSFCEFAPAEIKAMGQVIRQLAGEVATGGVTAPRPVIDISESIEPNRARKVIPILRKILEQPVRG